ncbi:MAG: hypothetical protein MUF62_10035 [Chitinophagaceae bacterium]|nr:hypothetical protein [Chitinophagaceae bacterium]
MKKVLQLLLLQSLSCWGIAQNVGIGIASPNTRLDVNGAIRARGNALYFTETASKGFFYAAAELFSPERIAVSGGALVTSDGGTLGIVNTPWANVHATNLTLQFGATISNRVVINDAGVGSGIYLGGSVAGKEPSAGRIGYSLFTSDAVDIVGGGQTADTRLLKIWAEGGTQFTGGIQVAGFSKLGGNATGVPAVKMKKLTATGPAVNGQLAVAHGLSSGKILSVSVLMEYGLGPTETLPAHYTTSPGFEYEWQVRPNDIYLINKNGNSANIGSRPVRILIVYEE